MQIYTKKNVYSIISKWLIYVSNSSVDIDRTRICKKSIYIYILAGARDFVCAELVFRVAYG